MTIRNIPNNEWTLLSKGLKYPDNEEWWEGHAKVLERAISKWKSATPVQRKKWEDGGIEFYSYLDTGFSDDDWDYVQSSYTYMSIESIARTPARFLGPIMKRAIIESVWDSDLEDKLSDDTRKEWWARKDDSFKDLYKSGHVTRQFAEVMKPFENDDEAWKAIEVFYDSGSYYH